MKDKKVEAVFKDIIEDEEIRAEIKDEGGPEQTKETTRADGPAFVVPKKRMSKRRRKEVMQVVFLLAVIFTLLIITGILFYVPA